MRKSKSQHSSYIDLRRLKMGPSFQLNRKRITFEKKRNLEEVTKRITRKQMRKNSDRGKEKKSKSKR